MVPDVVSAFVEREQSALGSLSHTHGEAKLQLTHLCVTHQTRRARDMETDGNHVSFSSYTIPSLAGASCFSRQQPANPSPLQLLVLKSPPHTRDDPCQETLLTICLRASRAFLMNLRVLTVTLEDMVPASSAARCKAR